jgi:hypothetical protein
MRGYLEDKINKVAKNSKNKNTRDLHRGKNEFRRGYQPRNNFVKNENGDLLADTNANVNRLKSYFSQLMKVHNVNNVRQRETYNWATNTWSQSS